MSSNSRTDRDIFAIKRTISSNYDRFKTLGVFFLEKSEVMKKIAGDGEEAVSRYAGECREGGVRWRNFVKHMNRAEKDLIACREITDGSQTEEKVFSDVLGMPVGEFVRIRESAYGVSVSFSLTGTFDVLRKGNRNGISEAHGIGVTPETSFDLVNELYPFWEDKYSVALKSEEFSVALSAENPKLGKKGTCCAKLYVIDDSGIRIDDLSKYIDVTPLTMWINP